MKTIENDEDDSTNLLGSNPKPHEFQRVATGRATAEITKKRSNRKKLFQEKDTLFPGQEVPQGKY